MEIDKDNEYRDDNPAWDYIAGVIHPAFDPHLNRMSLANACVRALVLEDGPLHKYHASAALLLEGIAIRLMGRTWVSDQIYNLEHPPRVGE